MNRTLLWALPPIFQFTPRPDFIKVASFSLSLEVCNSYGGSSPILVIRVFVIRVQTNPIMQSPSCDTFLKVVEIFLEFYETCRFTTLTRYQMVASGSSLSSVPIYQSIRCHI
jgi:hypothetical protein